MWTVFNTVPEIIELTVELATLNWIRSEVPVVFELYFSCQAHSFLRLFVNKWSSVLTSQTFKEMRSDQNQMV